MTRLLILVFAVCRVFGQAAEATAGSRRIALVLENSGYRHLPALPATHQEADLIAGALRKAGFEVSPLTNLTMSEFLTLIPEFSNEVKQGDVCVVYFSGYAVQGEDDNYFLPVDFDPDGPGEIEDRAYHLKKLQGFLDSKGAVLKIYILEGSRALNRTAAGIVGPGLREPDLNPRYSGGSLFAFSAYLDQIVPASTSIGLFSHALAENINVDGKLLSDVFKDTKSQVGSRSGGTQIPYVVDNLLSQDFYFHTPKPPERQTGVSAGNKRDRLEYVFIKAGSFKMGCVPDSRCDSVESPQHSVTLTKNFWMGQTEVEVVAYRERFLPSQGKKVRSPPKPIWGWTTNHPIVNITWEEAKSYCSWAGGRLPTEAEWEYAARAGMDDQVYPLDSENSRDKANFTGKKGNDIFDYVAPVKSFDANPFKLFDLAGNVWEWVNDYYSPTYYSEASPTDPTGPAQGKEHVARGGSWDSDPNEHLRLSYRKHFDKAGNTLGFRCVLDDARESEKLLGLPVPGTLLQRTAGTGQANEK